MTLLARSTSSAVKSFEQISAEIKEYSSSFDKGFNCLDNLYGQLGNLSKILHEHVQQMSLARESLAIKIHSFEETLARLSETLNMLQEQWAELEAKRDGTSPTITVASWDDITFEVPNPTYVAICTKIEAVEKNIVSVSAEIHACQTRLNHANAVDKQLASHISVVKGVISSIEEKKTVCKKLQEDIQANKRNIFAQSSIAIDKLKSIQQLISDYLKVKMLYDSTTSSATNIDSGQTRIDDTISIFETSSNNKEAEFRSSEESQSGFSREEIRRHGIKLDEAGRVTMYDGKTFGGKFNSYDIRLGKTIADDNPMLGRYEGVRGESKFIPSERTAEGVGVIKILQQYGQDGVVYRNAEPDFEPCAEAVVKIPHMTEKREYNYSQADIELAKVWNHENREGKNNWEARDVTNYRKANGLSWHEKCDMETMVLVPTAINHFFKHIGGVSECRVKNAGTTGGGFDE